MTKKRQGASGRPQVVSGCPRLDRGRRPRHRDRHDELLRPALASWPHDAHPPKVLVPPRPRRQRAVAREPQDEPEVQDEDDEHNVVAIHLA